MMLSHPVFLGFLWSLLLLSTSGQPQTSSDESNKVYAYSYHFQHNGTTNSRDILRNFLGLDPDVGLDASPVDRNIVRTFSSPGIRGFFTKGVLPAGPLAPHTSFDSPFNTVRNFVESNLHPPGNVAEDILPPISPDIAREFPGGDGFNSVVDDVFRDDFPNKIPSPPALVQNVRDVGFPKIPPVPDVRDFPKIPNDAGPERKVEDFSRDTPDGGRIEGRLETFSYNPPPVSNSISRSEASSEGFRKNENIINNNRELTGYRTQSFFRTNFRTVTPRLDSNSFSEHSSAEHRNSVNNNNNNNNQWWNVMKVLGNRQSGINPPSDQMHRDIDGNINQIRDNINRAFGARLSGFRRQTSEVPSVNLNNNGQGNFAGHGRDGNGNQNYRNQVGNQNFNNPAANQNLGNQNFNNPALNQNFGNQNFNNLAANQNFGNQNLNNPAVNQNFGNQNFHKPVFNNNPTRNQNYPNPTGNQHSNGGLLNNRVLPNIEIIPFNRADGNSYGRNSNNNPNSVFNSNQAHANNVVNPGVHNRAFNNPIHPTNIPNPPLSYGVFNNPTNMNNIANPSLPNGVLSNNPIGDNSDSNPPIPNRVFNNQHDKEIQNRVMNLIQDVSSHLKDLHNSNRKPNDIGPRWDDDLGLDRITNQDWSARTRPFSNGHSGPANLGGGPGPDPSSALEKTFENLARNTDFNAPRNQGNGYRNVNGGGSERSFGFDRTVDGPNSFSRDRQRGYERDFNVNSDRGFNRANQWSTNTVRRLDAQSSKADFSTDFIDVFKDD